MGLERHCRVTLGTRASEGNAHCGDGLLEFRGEFKLSWKWSDLRILSAEEGILEVQLGDQIAAFELGDASQKWQSAILNPKTWVQKMGLRAGQAYRIIGPLEQSLVDDLLASSGVNTDSANAEVTFYRMSSTDDLMLLDQIRAEGGVGSSVWTIFPKGQSSFKDNHIRDYARANGWIDIKIASIDGVLTSMKFVQRKV